MPVKMDIPICIQPIRGEDDYFAVVQFCMGIRDPKTKRAATFETELCDDSLPILYQLYIINIPLTKYQKWIGNAKTGHYTTLTEKDLDKMRLDLYNAFEKKYGKVKYVLYARSK